MPASIMHPGNGWIEVICGSMYSGKTEELIRRLRLARIARKNVIVIKPTVDTRYSKSSVVSHNEQSIPCVTVKDSAEILRRLGDEDVIAVDEAQFFDEGIVAVCESLAREGRRVIVAGLDKDFRGKPFHPMPELMAVAEFVTKNMAICIQCGQPANFSQRLTLNDEQVLLGARDVYEARCRSCFIVPREEQLGLFVSEQTQTPSEESQR